MASSLDKLQKDAVTSIASVSTLLHNAIATSISVAPEQYLTIAIPGTVIDLADYDQGGSFVYDATKHVMPPTTVRQSEARLVDGMMPIAKIMLGNTGKSVARSYSRALDGLVPAKADISTSTGLRSSGSLSYKAAMEFLRYRPDGTGKTVVDIYCEKQKAWGEMRSAWDKCKIDAEKEAEKKFPPGSSPDFVGKQKQFINDRNQEQYHLYKAAIQAAWMDWVVNGRKLDVDYNFGMININSTMQRIEASKESLRNSTIPDSNGASEVYGVSLTPNRWATYCKRKAEGWYAQNGGYTLSQLNAEIARLTSLLESYNLAEASFKDQDMTHPITNPTESTTKPIETQATLAIKMKELNRLKLEGDTLISATGWISSKKDTINKELERLQMLRTNKINANPVTVPVIADAASLENDQDKKTPQGLLLAAKGAENANPIFNTPLGAQLGNPGAPGGNTLPLISAEDADPWTTITFSYSASDLKNNSEESSWGMKVGGSVGFGLWSTGSSYSHEEPPSSMQSEMAACDVSVSFSALVVNINRPWLHEELFSDIELELTDGVNLSPGPPALRRMIDSQNVEEIAMYSKFPAYPTTFIVAADATIEFSGSTKNIEQAFDSHSNSGGPSVRYGPWSASKQSMQLQSTATGCKLSFGAPQVIGWISQILPALPRPKAFNPLTQGAGLPLPS